MSPKVYSYLRFSSPEQSQGDSRRRQMDAAKAWAAEHKMDLDEELHDEGISGFRGANLHADAALGSFLRAVQAGAVAPGSVFIVESLDRLSRQHARKALRVLEDICDGGVDVVTLSDGKRYTADGLDRDPTALLMSLLIFMRANEESETKALRLRAAWSAKRVRAVEQGQRMTTLAPAWLKAEGEGWTLVPERVAIVRRIFAETLEGRGQHMIAEALTAEEVPTWRRGVVWHRTYVKKLLANPAVIGTAELHETTRKQGGGQTRTKVATVEGYYPPIIDPETWERVQALAGERTSRLGRPSKAGTRHLLAALARCPICAGTMTRTNKGRDGGKPYLVCVLAKRKGRCVHRNVPVELVDAAIFADLGTLMETTPSTSTEAEELQSQLTGLEAESDVVTDELQDIREARRSRTLTPAHARREADLYAMLHDLDVRRDVARKALAQTFSPIVEARAGRLLETLQAGPQEDLTAANAAMREAFKAVVVDWRDGSLGFQWRQGGETWVTYDWARTFAESDEPG